MFDLVTMLRSAAQRRPDQGLVFYEQGRPGPELGFGALEATARSIAAHLSTVSRPGERAVLLYPPEVGYISAFFGCLFAGMIAVPAYPPDPSRLARTLPRLLSVIQDAGATTVLTTSSIMAMAPYVFEVTPELADKRWIATDATPHDPSAWQPLTPRADDLAFLQYTSGSTGAPKGVMLTHRALMANLSLISDAFQVTEGSVGVSWLPPYHDMGLIGGILQPIYKCARTALMSPLDFLRDPMVWLRAISEMGATTSGGPNFAYDLCVRKSTEESRAGLDLSTWRLAFSGAEPVQHNTIRRFATTFGPAGFRREAFYPCYGLAEATLLVTGAAAESSPRSVSVDSAELEKHRAVPVGDVPSARTLVSCGSELPLHRVVVVEPETGVPVTEGLVGEIWVSGESVAAGYWNKAELTAHAFDNAVPGEAGRFLRTGDLGFFLDGDLFITGRLKDLLIIRGRNHYPQDIEETVTSAHAALRKGCCAAFSVADGGESCAIAVEVERRWQGERVAQDRRTTSPDIDAASPKAAPDYAEVARAIRQAVAAEHGIALAAVVLVKALTIPKTSSGKIQRQLCRLMYASSGLDELYHWQPTVRLSSMPPAAVDGPVSSDDVLSVPAGSRRQWLLAELISTVQRLGRFDRGVVSESSRLNELGLDSLAAVEIAQVIERRFGVSLPLGSLLKDLPLGLLAAELHRTVEASASESPRSAIEEDGRLSPGQEALWFLDRAHEASTASQLTCAVVLRTPVDAELLRATFRALAARHAALRMRISEVEGRPRVVVLPSPQQPPVTTTDVDPRDPDSYSAPLRAIAAQRLDLAEAGPLAVHLLTRAPGDHLMVVVAHHMVLDLWSIVLLLQDLDALPDDLVRGQPPALPEIDFRDHVRWQRAFAKSAAGERQLAYWRQLFADSVPVLTLPVDRPREEHQGFAAEAHWFRVDPAVAGRVAALAKSEHLTPFVVFAAAWARALGSFSGQRDVVVGVPVAGRSRAAFERVVGYLVNPVALRVRLPEEHASIRTLLHGVRESLLGALDNSDVPFPAVVAAVDPPRSFGKMPLFQNLLVFEKPHRSQGRDLAMVAMGVPSAATRLAGMDVESMRVDEQQSHFELELSLFEASDGVHGRLVYRSPTYASETAARIARCFLSVLESFTTDVARPLRDAAVVAGSARDEALARSRGPVREWPERAPTLHGLVEEQVARTPDQVALVHREHAVTYRELDERAARVAARLVDVEADVVAIVAERSIELYVAMLGVLKSGRAYLPIDPDQPQARVATMFDDAGTRVALVHGRVTALPAGVEAIEVSEASRHERRPTRRARTDAAYVMFTSGSTGRPKGVVCPHRGIRNRILWGIEDLDLRAADRVLQKTPVTFDVSVPEIFATLARGATLVIADPGGHRDPFYLRDVLRSHQVTVVHFVPSMLRPFLDVTDEPPHLRLVQASGEALGTDLVSRFATVLPGTPLVNLYGPTEASVEVTTAWCRPGGAVVPIGVPVANTSLYVLDGDGELAPLGAVGELHIGGIQVAAGYVGRPDLTAERFVADPFGEPGTTMYRTGDLVRWNVEGRLEYLGRGDQQVKIRGVRIELDEICSHVREHPGLRDVAILQDGDSLTAYVVPGNAAPTAEGLRAFLLPRLPEVMIPRTVVGLDALPTNSSGKLDRAALPRATAATAPAAERPLTPLETILLDILRDVLAAPHLTHTDDFFRHGGHSLAATRAVALARQILQVEIPLRLVFEHSTVERLASATMSEPRLAIAAKAASILMEASRQKASSEGRGV